MILHKDKDVLVTLEEDGLVKKIVMRPVASGLRKSVPPAEMVDREIRALKIAKEVPNVQRFVKRGVSSDTFYSQYIPGVHLSEYPEPLPSKFFDCIESSLKACRIRGVYRLDRFFNAERDIIVQPDLTPGIIDFGNVLFPSDPRARIPYINPILEGYNFIQIRNLRNKYQERNI